jgi:DNA-binding PadR family transcriptional regulator
MYGYELAKKALEVTNGDLDITEGALYPALHKMEAEGLLQTEIERVGNRPRKYYRLTETGGKEARNRIAELAEYAANLQLFLNPRLRHG